MSDNNADKLAPLHELLKDPIRQKILLFLGEHNGVSFDDLMKHLKIVNPEELGSQLKLLGDLVTKKEDDEYSLTEQGVSKRPSGQYMLTEKGHDAVDEMIAFPEIESKNYKEEVNRKFFGEAAVQRHKLFYVLIGALAGFSFTFSGGAFISIISVQLGGPTLMSFQNGWPLFGNVALIAAVPGALIGYWIGERKKFKRPQPEWND
jgi:DNA-binding HxlR family transcriptional regulator